MLRSRELKELFHNPVFYVIVAVFLSLSGYKFFSLLQSFIEESSYYPEYVYGSKISSMMGMDVAYYIFPQLFMFYSYLCVMAVSVLGSGLGHDRLMDMDKIELLSTSKSIKGLIFRKIISCSIVIYAMLIPTLIYPLIINIFTSVDWGLLLASYIGIFFLVLMMSGINSIIGVFRFPVAVGIFLNMVILLFLHFYFFENMYSSFFFGAVKLDVVLFSITVLLSALALATSFYKAVRMYI